MSRTAKIACLIVVAAGYAAFLSVTAPDASARNFKQLSLAIHNYHDYSEPGAIDEILMALEGYEDPEAPIRYRESDPEAPLDPEGDDPEAPDTRSRLVEPEDENGPTALDWLILAYELDLTVDELAYLHELYYAAQDAEYSGP